MNCVPTDMYVRIFINKNIGDFHTFSLTCPSDTDENVKIQMQNALNAIIDSIQVNNGITAPPAHTVDTYTTGDAHFDVASCLYYAEAQNGTMYFYYDSNSTNSFLMVKSEKGPQNPNFTMDDFNALMDDEILAAFENSTDFQNVRISRLNRSQEGNMLISNDVLCSTVLDVEATMFMLTTYDTTTNMIYYFNLFYTDDQPKETKDAMYSYFEEMVHSITFD